jgi:hypothetical protein
VYPEDGFSRLLRNVSNFLPDYLVAYSNTLLRNDRNCYIVTSLRLTVDGVMIDNRIHLTLKQLTTTTVSLTCTLRTPL